jgi:prepilin-type N-terminal cleavage/methylation domain-containing protein
MRDVQKNSAARVRRSGTTRWRRRGGFSIPEVMIAMAVATIGLFALLNTSIYAYKINHKARLRDNARTALRSFADQFQRLSYSTEDGIIRAMFTPTTEPTGLGLRWGKLCNEINWEGAPTVCTVDIGPPGIPVVATVTRDVTNVRAADGDTATARDADAAGFMLKATFTIRYPVGRETVVQSLSTLKLN